MQKVRNEKNPLVFQNRFTYITHQYPTHYSKNSFNIPFVKLNYLKRSISYRGPFLWNNLVDEKSKETASLCLFKATIKKYLFEVKNEINYF